VIVFTLDDDGAAGQAPAAEKYIFHYYPIKV